MNWEIINTKPVIPKCMFCDGTTDQMARIHIHFAIDRYNSCLICSNCGPIIKDCMNEWKDLKSTDYIENDNFKSRCFG